MTVRAAVVVDSRNVLHQAGDAIGVQALPTVAGVKQAVARYGFDAIDVHIGLALARLSDRASLARHHADNDAYRQKVLADGGQVLLGELHRKKSGAVEEKMVDVRCGVMITRLVDEIHHERGNLEAIVVMSKDIDLTPAVDYAVEMRVAVFVAALDVVQHRRHPYVLLAPHSYAELTGTTVAGNGHELRELLACALYDGTALRWTVSGPSRRPRLKHACGLTAVPAPGVTLPPQGGQIELYPVDVTWIEEILGSFPVLVCDTSPARKTMWVEAQVLRRAAPMTVDVERSNGELHRVQHPIGGVVPGERMLIHLPSGRALGRLRDGTQRTFDPDVPTVLRVVSPLPRGGALVVDETGTRGLMTTQQLLSSGQRLPAVQIDTKPRGPVWSAIGMPLP